MEGVRRIVNEIAYTQSIAKLPPLRRSLVPLLFAASSIYKLLLSLRHHLYQLGFFQKHRLPVPVISVGNLTWGGNGKTPMVEFIALWLADSGISPLILSRCLGQAVEMKIARIQCSLRPLQQFTRYCQLNIAPQHQNLQILWLLHPASVNQLSQLCTNRSISNLPNWSVLISKYINQGSLREALDVYKQIRYEGVYYFGVIPLLLKACASLSFLDYGKALHAESIKAGSDSDIMIGTALIDIYAKCGTVLDSHQLFEAMPQKNVVTWNAMINGYLKNGDINSASILFDKMPGQTAVTWSQMIDGFARSGDLVTARQLFDRVPPDLKNVRTWTVMVDGYARRGKMEAAREIFEQMPQRNFFVWSCMICGYSKIGNVREARAIFGRVLVRNMEIWNSMLSGYVQNGFFEEALQAFADMQADGFEPDEFTVVSILSACAQLGLLASGKKIHHMIRHKEIKMNHFVLCGLIDMYAKCGDLINARLVFEEFTKRNIFCWNAMLSGFAINGKCHEVLEFFGRMENSNIKPDGITFLTVLTACAHGGLVNEALEVISKMETCGVEISIKHYGCMVDLLGRAGRLKEADELIKRMPMEPNDTVLGAMLGACWIHSDLKMAEEVMKEISAQSLDFLFGNNSYNVLMSNIYAASEKWEKAERMRMVLGYGGGDEVNMLRRHFLGTPTKFGVGANRAAVASHFIQKYGYVDTHKSSWNEELSLNWKMQSYPESEKVGVVVLDDAMQHWSLRRDLEIVMVNGLSLWGNLQLLPLGPLREPLTALRRADVVVVHHADLVSEDTLKDIESNIQGVKKSVPMFFTKMDPSYLFDVGVINSKIPLRALHEALVLCVSAIGSADSLVKQIQKMGAIYVDRVDFSDHHKFDARDIDMIRARLRELEDKFGCEPIVLVTEKDFDRDPEILKQLYPFKVLVLCSKLKVVSYNGSTEDSFKKFLKDQLVAM
ncbi:pentatricopeptide repeat-containing protein [Senna tora]|uniref:Pentatricopeptide repeat-containing protein n=1 Tax=Senna tora TaxID=362788 RepID=A0A834WC98_9FABA|nr:pentatricopeptide repeat-containing protein [Senna tora]